MKTIAHACMIFLLSLTACKKDNPSVTQPEHLSKGVLENLLEHNEIVDTVILGNNNELELGMRFYSSVKGEISHIGGKMPSPGKFNVSLWDYASKQLLVSIVLDNYPDKFTYIDIKDIPAMANQRFVISVNNVTEGVSRPYYISKKKSSSGSVYPFNAGNITYEAFHSKLGATPLFPDAVTEANQSYVAGYPDIIFKQ